MDIVRGWLVGGLILDVIENVRIVNVFFVFFLSCIKEKVII